MHENIFENSEIIHRYSRKNMTDDGHLIEVPEKLCKEAGIKFPVGILVEVWESCVAWSPEDSERQTHQDESGRLWDILYTFRTAVRRASGDTLFFKVARIPRDGKSTKPETVTLKSVIGPGDDPSPVITLMFPDQD